MSSTNLATNRARLIAELDDEVGRKSSTATVMFQSAVADRLGLGLTDLICGEILSRTGPITAGELAELSGLTTGAITGVIDRLERGGFVVRVNDPDDRRRVMLQPRAERFAQLGADPYKQLSERFVELFKRFDDRELAAILDYMKGAIDIFDEEAAYWRAETAAKRKGLTREQVAGMAPHQNEKAVHGKKGGPRVQVKADVKIKVDTNWGKKSDKLRKYSAPLANDQPGRLEFESGSVVFELGALTDGAELYRAEFEHDIPTVRNDGNAVSVRFRQRTLFGRGGGNADMLLSPAVPWDFKIDCGASQVRADLSQFELLGWDFRSKASHIWLNLPVPTQTVELRLESSASEIEIYRPVGVPVRIETEGDWSNLEFDEYDEPAQDEAHESPDYKHAQARYHIVVRGSASTIVVQERAGQNS